MPRRPDAPKARLDHGAHTKGAGAGAGEGGGVGGIIARTAAAFGLGSSSAAARERDDDDEDEDDFHDQEQDDDDDDQAEQEEEDEQAEDEEEVEKPVVKAKAKAKAKDKPSKEKKAKKDKKEKKAEKEKKAKVRGVEVKKPKAKSAKAKSAGDDKVKVKAKKVKKDKPKAEVAEPEPEQSKTRAKAKKNRVLSAARRVRAAQRDGYAQIPLATVSSAFKKLLQSAAVVHGRGEDENIQISAEARVALAPIIETVVQRHLLATRALLVANRARVQREGRAAGTLRTRVTPRDLRAAVLIGTDGALDAGLGVEQPIEGTGGSWTFADVVVRKDDKRAAEVLVAKFPNVAISGGHKDDIPALALVPAHQSRMFTFDDPSRRSAGATPAHA